MNGKMQERVKAFVESHGLQTDVAHRVLDLASELGEVAKEVLKGTNYGAATFKPGPNWDSELGDLMFALACIANSTGVDLENALEGALKKYSDRIAKTKSAASS
jgi:NTP pyrophosphatase (non-canonical NTP hydrolase)